MEILGNNRYHLLYIDDDASDLCVGQLNLQDSCCEIKAKCSNLSASKKATQAKLSTTKTKVKGKSEQIVANAGPKLMLCKASVEQQSAEAHELLQRPEPPLQHRYFKERSVSSRIISNSSKGGGYSYGRLHKSKFDRHSGSDKTGIKAVVKRNGGGAHNWGSPIKDIEEQSLAIKNHMLPDKDDAFNELQVQQQSQQQQPPQQQEKQQQQQQLQQLSQQAGDSATEEDDGKFITVEEWRAMRVERVKPIYNIRKAGEGELNKPDWKKMIVLPKKKPMKLDSDSCLEYEASMYPQRVGRLQRIMDIEFKFKDDRRRCGFRNGWAGERMMSKSDAESVSDPINMHDEIEFPTLG